jgi:hypothetical protein
MLTASVTTTSVAIPAVSSGTEGVSVLVAPPAQAPKIRLATTTVENRINRNPFLIFSPPA